MRFLQSVDASLIGLGTQMLSEVAAGVLLGLAADYLLGTKNRWVVVGSITGVVVAMWTVIRVAMRLQAPRRQAPGSKPAQPPRSDGESAGPT
ncbi:MAG: putative F0F1-ATPase subunit Ca2+/Mg2+ transporter [Planctomycetota bacterium]|jgi:F0F1-type ATP synthase assembly protein I